MGGHLQGANVGAESVYFAKASWPRAGDTGTALRFEWWLSWDWILVYLICTWAQTRPNDDIPDCSRKGSCLGTFNTSALSDARRVVDVDQKGRKWGSWAPALHQGLPNALKSSKHPLRWEALGHWPGTGCEVPDSGAAQLEAGSWWVAEMRLESQISDLNSGLLNYSVHPKSPWFGFLSTALGWNRISSIKEPDNNRWAFAKNILFQIQGLAERDERRKGGEVPEKREGGAWSLFSRT